MAAVIFLAGSWLSWLALRDSVTEVRWEYIVVVAVVGVPLAILLNAWELRLTGVLVERDVPLARCLRVVVLGTAANLLPVPGAAMLRVALLTDHDAGIRSATKSTVFAALVWLGSALAVAAVALLWMRRATFAGVAGLLAAGVGVVIIPLWLRLDGNRRAGWMLVAVETAAVAVQALRLLLVLLALGFAVKPAQALVLAGAGVLAATAGVFPSGFGLAELFSAGLAEVVGLTGAMGFAASALNRLVGLAFLGPLAGFLAAGSHSPASDIGSRDEGCEEQ